jgi:hypothetical protein
LDEGTWQQLKAVTTPLLAYGIAVALAAGGRDRDRTFDFCRVKTSTAVA